MEFVGRAVTVARSALGGSLSSGTVRSYDASSGLSLVIFDDGDSEELDLSVAAGGEEGGTEGELCRKPTKRRRLGDPANTGNVSLNFPVDCVVLDETLGNGGLSEGNLEIGGNGNLKIGGDETLGVVNGDSRDELDLNAGFNSSLNEDFGFRPEDGATRNRDGIDLNLDANGDCEEGLDLPGEAGRTGWKFDLNLDVVEDAKEDLDGRGGIGMCVDGRGKNEVSGGKIVEDANSNGTLKSSELDTEANGDDVKPRDGVLEAVGTPVNDDNSESPCGQRSSRRKRRKTLDIEETPKQTVLRRSSRRGAGRNRVLEDMFAVSDTPSPAVTVVTEEKPGPSVWKEPEKPIVILPPKLELPPSSRNIDLSDFPVLDLFSVYSCLQSFSTLLFLSPFEFEEFVAALKSKSPSLLLDSVHVSILKTLRKHLEFLSNEGSEAASECLRSLNWDFLDEITWPMFMAEYYLIYDPELKPKFDLSSLKLFKGDYYQQPTPVKVEILRCLCDDLIEVEAIRSELNRRSLAAEPDMLVEKNLKYSGGKKRRTSVGISIGSCMDDDVAADSVDRNYDECCLCKMDGNLICCDGCPAAYHSKCVGIACDNLPVGDWFCPECAIDRNNPSMKPRKSLRGAEILGIDPHGRLYFHSSGYLLVSDSYDTESLFSYYHKDDLSMVVEVLKSADFFYGDILVAIWKHWGNINANGNIGSLYSMPSNMFVKGPSSAVQNPLIPLTLTETHPVKHRSNVEEKTNIGDSGLANDVVKSVNLSDAMPVTGSSLVTSEESAETPQTQIFSSVGCDLKYSHLDTSQEAKSALVGTGYPSAAFTTKREPALQEQCGINYVNYYSFGRIASSIAEDLIGKSSEKIKEVSLLTEEEITSRQMRIIVKRCPKFCWSNIYDNMDVQKEKCGWCFTCRAATDVSECLFFMNLCNIKESSDSDILALQSNNKKSHLTDILYQILSIENRLRGLLLGPWLNPNYSKLWRRSAVKAFDMASVKQLLLSLESNISPFALSTEWSKHVDSDVSMGSASHIITSSARGSSKHLIARRRSKGLDSEPGPTLNPSSGLGIFWWRGGTLTRKVFNWKVLPRSLVSKAARQGGCTKIPGILYPENSEYSKRTKNLAWRAAVETSTSAEQLAFQLRELDSNIKWDDIENTHPFPTLDKEAKKSFRLFKKVIVRRKSIQGGLVKYLLDFGGKRRAIPDVVLKNGSLIVEASSDKKKYWLQESFVPLHLLKNFEDKRISRKSNDAKSEKLFELVRVKKRPRRKEGIEYLFSKAEKSENYQCGHCSKDVLIREAVSCELCKGFFHKRHVKKSAGAILAECTYTCHRCHNGIRVRTETKKGKTDKKGSKLKLQKPKNVQTDLKSSQLKSSKNLSTRGKKAKSKNKKKAMPVVPLRRSTRKVKCLVVQKKKRGRKKGKPVKSKKGTKKEKPNKVPSCKRKRTEVSSSYWLNGLRFSRKPNDERVTLFMSKRFQSSSEGPSVTQPKCQLCDEAAHSSDLNYVACEICEEWFHADAVGVHSDKIENLTGFRCHNCCERGHPICPHSVLMKFKSDVSQLVEIQNDAAAECVEEVSNAVPPLSELQVACN